MKYIFFQCSTQFEVGNVLPVICCTVSRWSVLCSFKSEVFLLTNDRKAFIGANNDVTNRGEAIQKAEILQQKNPTL
jgi:hypothetical protein